MQFPGMRKHFEGLKALFANGSVPVVHYGITCDGSDQNPLVGTRYHKIGHNYDLNETEFAKLTRDEQEKYEVIAFPGEVPVPFKNSATPAAVHPKKDYNPCGHRGRHGNGHSRRGCGYQRHGRHPLVKSMEFPGNRKHFEGLKALFANGSVPVVHFGITCDGSDQNPLVGTRYHKIGHNYDLNETEFAKLTRDEQEKYEVIAFPGDVPVPFKTNPTVHYGVICDGSNQ